jgi:reactive intermediate/imine deaminase
MKLIFNTRAAILTALFLGSLSFGQANAENTITPIYTGAKPIAPFTPAMKLSNGMLFVSGNIPYVKGAIPAYATDGKDDMADQSKIVMENLKTVLEAAGYTFDDVVKASVFMTNMNNYGTFNKVYGSYWGEGKTPPAREAIAVRALPGGKPGAEVLVEVSMIAFK